MNKYLPSSVSAGFALVLCIGFLIAGVWVGVWYEDTKRQRLFPEERRTTATATTAAAAGQLTNPLLECGLETNELGIGERKKIEDSVTAFVTAELKRGTITESAVYFRDLNNGPWFGINERNLFEPGSLLKLPIAMSIYYWDQRARGVLDHTIDLTNASTTQALLTNTASANVTESLVAPGVYTVRDLVGIMLRNSSNDAANVLAQFEGPARMNKIFSDLGIEPPSMGNRYTTDVKTYGAFFRVLYNASYVGEPASEEILTTLTQASFREGLVAGVPSTVKVAHKFGTRIVDDGRRQLHDCGIVYTESPYVLCVMTQGRSVHELERIIAQVSKRVYEGVTK